MLISIITINYNNVAGLKKTMDSVYVQTYTSIEYIVIDGGSTDDSKAYIESCQQDLAYWISEPDKGIYHAMNKGIDKATGDYLLFLNSGDWLVDNLVIEKFINYKPEKDIIYGNSIFIHEDGRKEEAIMPNKLGGIDIFNFTLNHQAIFHKKNLFVNNQYDLNYQMLADWAFYNEAIIKYNRTYEHKEFFVSYYDMSGFSSNPKNKNVMQKDRMLFYTKHADVLMPILLEEYYYLRKKLRKFNKSKLIKLLLKIEKNFK